LPGVGVDDAPGFVSFLSLDDGEPVKLGPVVLALAAAFAAPAALAVGPHPGTGHALRHCRGGVLHRVGTPTTAYAALMRKKRTEVFRRPKKARIARFPKVNQNGYPMTFAIVGAIVNKRCTASWYRVKLPIRPNGAVGYVRPADVFVQRVRTRIVVDVSERRLFFYRARRLVLTTPVAVGSAATPTPIGRFYVNQRLVPTNPRGAYGPAALGVSAFSNVLTGWAQGGPIGIHGTNQPWSIGRGVSNGCIRVPNATLQRIFEASLGGTPVIFHP
jgi:lipoprotein-anchoring transpeptidase ErfK/SrfK